MSQEAMDAGVDVKVESDDEVEPYDGSYACGGDEGSSRGGGKRARGGKTGQCEHKRQRNRCKECGGEGICQHGRQRSMCKTCKADKDESMPPDLKVL